MCAILLSLSTVSYAEALESAYTLVRVDEKGENTITKFEWDETANAMVPKYYQVILNKTEYGDGANTRYYEWNKNSDGNLEFVQVTAPNADKTTITVHYGESLNRITSNQNGADIIGDFIGNFVNSRIRVDGGAILNEDSIGDITGDFIGNYAKSLTKEIVRGGAIRNNRDCTIGNIKGDFIGNYAGVANLAYGGAISSNGTIGDITGDFIGNHTESTNGNASGGAISSDRPIGDITGNFIGNYANGGSIAYGGAIRNWNDGTIGDIKGDFIGNYAESANGRALGGAISNEDTIDNITGNFIKNRVSGKNALGGAIYNGGTIDTITGDFINNNAGTAGGAIYAAGGSITVSGNFLNNSAKNKGGAIALDNNAIITVAADGREIYFKGNYIGSSDNPNYQAVYAFSPNSTLNLNTSNSGIISMYDSVFGVKGYSINITGDGTGSFKWYNRMENGNITIKDTLIDTADGKLTDYNILSLINDNTNGAETKLALDIDMSAKKSDKFVIENNTSGIIKLAIINQIGRKSIDTPPWIIQVLDVKNDTDGDFVQLALSDNIKVLHDEIASTVYDTDIYINEGAISLMTTNTENDSIGIDPTKIYDVLALLNKTEKDEDKSFIFVSDTDYALQEELGDTAEGKMNIIGKTPDVSSTGSTIDLNTSEGFNLPNETELTFKDITLTDKTGSEKQNSIINIENENAVVNLHNTKIIDNNTTAAVINNQGTLNITAEGRDSILDNNGEIINDGTITLTPSESGKIIISDSINSNNDTSVITINPESVNSIVELNNKISNNNVILDNGTLKIGEIKDTAGNVEKYGTFDNGTNLTVNNGIISLINNAINTNHVNLGNVTLNSNLNLSLDVDPKNWAIDQITFNDIETNGNYIDISNINILSIPTDRIVSVSPIANITDKTIFDTAKNSIIYNGPDKILTPICKYTIDYTANDGMLNFRAPSGGNNYSDFNPAVMASPVMTQVGGYLTQLQTLQDGFFHMNRYTKYPQMLRMTAEMSNKNAITETPVYNKSILPETSQSMWVKPYTSFEKVQLKGGVGVSNVTYGALYGGDSDLVDLGHGFKGVISTFIGYNGSHQSYDGISMNQQGGTLGLTGTLYKGNFFTGLTVSTGASAGEAYTPYGTDNFAMITAGAASKTGYNWEIKEGKFIIQPSLFLGYTFVNTFDYTNAAGVRINSDPLNAIQIIPGVKFIGNLKNGWQPYVGVDMVWNIMDKTDVMANDIRLPQLSVKPYVQYGVGFQKSWGERFTAFFQTMIRNGGRNGIALTGGFRWALGKEHKPINTEKYVIKKRNNL